jgi:type IV secretion system protein VirB10
VSTNNPYQPGDGTERPSNPSYESHGGADPLASNPYSAQQREASAPDLDAGAPQLQTNDIKRMNRRALMFLAGIIALVLVVAMWMLKSATTRNDVAPPKAREETVSIPDAPKAPPPMPAPKLPDPIPVTQNAPPLPPMPQPPSRASFSEGPRGPTLVERRMMTGDAAAQGVPAQATQAPAAPGMYNPFAAMQNQQLQPPRPYGSEPPLSQVSNAQPLTSPDTLLLRGTFIRCVLQTRIVTDIQGFTSCVVTEPVYSFNGKRLLLPKGSKVLGSYEGMPTGDRVAVIWDRIVTPNGIDVNMSSPGVDNLGGAGHPGHYNAHWPSRIGAALLISLLSDAFKYEAAEHGPRQTTISNGVVTQTPFESNTAQTLQNLANQAVQRAANRPATVTINQGTVVSIYVAKDVDFSGVVARF